MDLTWFGHSAFRLRLPDACLLIDPFLSGNPRFQGRVEEVAAGTTHILLTHGHDDHVGDTVAIARQTGATLVANYELAMWLAGKGVAAVETMNLGGTLDCGAFAVTMVRADHSSGRTEEGVPIALGPAAGLVIRPKAGPTVYHMGDTALFGDMALIHEIHAPEIGLVPIGDRYTMDAASAALAVRRFFRFRMVIPCHYGTFPVLAPDASAFEAALAGHDTRVVVPAIGEAMPL